MQAIVCNLEFALGHVDCSTVWGFACDDDIYARDYHGPCALRLDRQAGQGWLCHTLVVSISDFSTLVGRRIERADVHPMSEHMWSLAWHWLTEAEAWISLLSVSSCWWIWSSPLVTVWSLLSHNHKKPKCSQVVNHCCFGHESVLPSVVTWNFRSDGDWDTATAVDPPLNKGLCDVSSLLPKSSHQMRRFKNLCVVSRGSALSVLYRGCSWQKKNSNLTRLP